MCGTMRRDGQQGNHTFQLLSKHGVSPCSATLPKYQRKHQEDRNSFPFGELEETTRTPSYYVDENYPARPEILNEATDVAQNRPLWRLMSTFGATHS